ncbi:MAG: hypothetical protein ACMUIE_02735 [Thermoplasmatota archaeon]
MMDDSDTIQEKLMDRVADLDAARNRWIFGIIFSVFLFAVVLGVYLAPVMELSTEEEKQFVIPWNTNTPANRVDTVAIPNLYFLYFYFELEPDFADEHSSVYVYIYKNEAPEISLDAQGDLTLHEYLKSKSFRNVTLNNINREHEWNLAFRDCDANTYYIIIYNPDDPNDPYDDKDVILNFKTHYEPMLPVVPIFFIIAFIIVLPIAIIRLYVVSQKKKELRVLLTLDLESLSDEDKLRLGIPIVPKKPMQVPYAAAPPQQPPMTPGQMH